MMQKRGSNTYNSYRRKSKALRELDAQREVLMVKTLTMEAKIKANRKEIARLEKRAHRMMESLLNT